MGQRAGGVGTAFEPPRFRNRRIPAGLYQLQHDGSHDGMMETSVRTHAVSRPDHRTSATYRSKSGRGGAPAEYENCKTNIRARRCLGWRPEEPQPAPLSSYKDKKCKTKDHTCGCRQERGASSRASCYQLARNRSYKGQMFQNKGPGKLIPAVWSLC